MYKIGDKFLVINNTDPKCIGEFAEIYSFSTWKKGEETICLRTFSYDSERRIYLGAYHQDTLEYVFGNVGKVVPLSPAMKILLT